MNKIYKVLWNHAAQNWVVTSELARGNVKSSTSQLTNQLTDQPTSQLKKSFTIATLSAVIIASLFSTSAMAYTPNANGREQAVTGSLAIGEQDDGSGSGSGATVSASNGGSSTAGWTTTTNSHHSIAIGGSSLVNNTANALAIGFKANLNNSTKGSVALGAYSTAGAAHTGGDAESIHIGGTTYKFAGKATNQTSVLSIGSGNNVTDWAAGARQNNRGHYSDRQGANTPNYNVRQIQNVAAGRVSSDSTDAINGSQLHAVVQAINASSGYVWKVTSDGGKNQSLQAVTKDETVTFAAGNNMEVMQDPNDLKKFIYSTKNDVTFNKVTVGGNEFNTDGLTIGNGPSMTKTGINAGNKTITNVANGVNNNDAVNVSQLNAAKSNVAAGTNVANVTTTTNADKSKTYTVNAIGTNVTSNNNLITATKTATANNTNNQTNTYTIGLKTKNVTANKNSDGKYDEIPANQEDGVVTAKALLEALKKAGWKLQANGVNTIIKAGDVVNFVNGTGTTASVTSSNQGNKITFNINTSNFTVSKAGTTTGTISADNTGNHFATATSVANAINGAFWKAKGAGNGSGHTEQPIHAGDLVTFQGGNGIKVDQNAGTFTFSLDEDYIKKHPGLKGPKGDKGAQGARGETGAAGRDGKNAIASVTTNQDGTHTINITDGNGTVSSAIVKNGKDGAKGETGAAGKDGKNAVASVTTNQDGTHTINITDGNGAVSSAIVKNGKDGEKGEKGETGAAGKDGKNAVASVTTNNDGTHTINITDGNGAVSSAIVKNGKDGKNAVANITENNDGSHTINITDGNGTVSSAIVKNGKDGAKGETGAAGKDGKNAVASVTTNQDGTHTINITDGNGTVSSAIVKNGKDGEKGEKGETGAAGKNAVASVTTNNDGTHTINITDGNGAVSSTIVKNGEKGEKGETGAAGKNAVASVTNNNDGTHTINITDGNGAVSSAIVKNGKDGEKGEDGKNAVASVTNNNDGTHTIKITDGNNKSTTTIVKDGKDGKNGTGGSGSNSDDGLKFTGNNEVVNNNKLNSKVIIKGEGVSKVKSETFKSAKGNINVKADGNATLEMQLAKDIDLGNDGSVTTGNTVINNNGITINNAAPNKTVSVTENGLNNGGNRIINVAPGIKGTDAVNVNQLRGAVNNIHNDMNKMDKRLSAGIAGAMSSANLYQATSSGKSMLSAGAGTYRGESAVAVGYSRLSDNGKFGVRFSANTNSRGDAGAAASVGYQW
ncbi:collagen-flanked surface repeat-containing protein [Haemophilus parainfluenzae]|uniref:YadA-like family protein n=1 Tax=Haemophilus parainfluenzae TaxID=729 RepID=A0AB36IQX1_HAEPA|nr:YadA-like family protein [Haemophilus parainfluenzae]OLV27639.1 hypothetical protein BSO15_03650 [Haemophilus parainfluenzae]